MKKKFSKKTIVFFALILLISTYFIARTYAAYPTAINLSQTPDRSGVNGNVVTVDDWLRDYNYYMGLNYTENNNGVLPTGESRNLYNDNNLVKATVTYSGVDMNNSSLVGYVSGSERQDTFIYYKYYPKNNGYIDIELIDTPFMDRPLDMGFNGWLTDYEGVTISFDRNYYKRYAHVPVSGNTLNITFHAHWVEGHYAVITSNNNSSWSNAFNSLGSGMEGLTKTVRTYEDVTRYYTYGGRTSRYGYYPDGEVYDYQGNNVSGEYCSRCYYYYKVTENNYDPDVTYYEPNNAYWGNQMNTHTVTYTDSTVPLINVGDKVGGYYTSHDFSWNQTVSGYYDDEGNYIDNGTCNNYGGCTYYKLIQYYDSNGNVNVSDGNTTYYRLITRDMNIIGLGVNLTYTWGSGQSKPFTFTSVYKYTNGSGNVVNGNNLDNYYWNISNRNVHCYNDTRIENMMIYANISAQVPTYSNGWYTYEGIGTSTNSSRFIYADYHNLKIGRGIIKRNDSQNFSVIIGGNNSSNGLGSSSNVTKYHLNIESGFYNAITLTNGAVGETDSKYIEALATYGNDYDRVKKDNNKLDIYWDVVGSFGGNYSAGNSTTGITMDTIVKSGRFGSQEGDDHTAGMYVGGRGGGVHSAVRRVKVEGGWIYNLIGGPLTANNRGNINDIYIYMTGGAVDVIIGGAGTSATYGNRWSYWWPSQL